VSSTIPARRFPPPWSVEEQAACFVVRDGNGHGELGLQTIAAITPFANLKGAEGQSKASQADRAKIR
jgi:hypothetical protein